MSKLIEFLSYNKIIELHNIMTNENCENKYEEIKTEYIDNVIKFINNNCDVLFHHKDVYVNICNRYFGNPYFDYYFYKYNDTMFVCIIIEYEYEDHYKKLFFQQIL